MYIKECIAITAALVLCAANLQAQEETREDFSRRYALLVSKLGADGVGIETLLNKWDAAYPDDTEMLIGKFSYYLSKAGRTSVVPMDREKYLGERPVLSLNDSTGKKINYFQDTAYDDDLFAEAQKSIDRAIQTAPDRLDIRFMQISSLIAYEKESPDMALSDLKSLVVYNEGRKPSWQYPGADKVDEDFFLAAIQEYCYLFFKYASQTSYEAFAQLSEQVLAYRPDNVLFLDNMGSYYLVAKRDDKLALKYYTRVLKLKKDDLTAIKNIIILARNTENVKLEKKYLPLLAKYGESDTERLSAQTRLESLEKK